MIYKDLLNRNLPEEIPDGFHIAQLTGDASSRAYYRIRVPNGETVMLMKMPEPFDESDFSYLRNFHLFRSIGVPLANILEMNSERGFVLLQDLGDDTFYELYDRLSEHSRLSYLLKTVEYQSLIEKAQPGDPLSFDTAKFVWEMNYFYNHFLIGFLKAEISESEKSELQEHLLKLSTELAGRPRFFCHRDYHSRNFMVHQDDVYVIDFQDARFGPATYDLASLCYDSYLQHPADLIQKLEESFFVRHPNSDTQSFEYPRMCLQRNLKALGTFGYQSMVLGRDFYRQFVPPTLEYVKKHFKGLPEYSDLSKILSRHLPEISK